MTGSCHECDEHQRNSTRRDYGNFVTQSSYGVESSQGAGQTQASDYSCGGLNERPVRTPDRTYQPNGYQAEEAQMSYPSPQQRETRSLQIPSYGYARQIHRARFVAQPSRLQVSHGRDGIELINIQAPSNRQNNNRSVNNFSDPSPYELEVSLRNRESLRVKSRNLTATPHRTHSEPSLHELQVSPSNSDNARSVSEHQEDTQDDTGNNRSGRPRHQFRRGNMDVMDRLPRPAPSPIDGERPPVNNRVAALRGERRTRSSRPSRPSRPSRTNSPVDRSQTVSPLTESDLSAPFVHIPEYDEYPEYPPFI
ncbi:hypothetical protein FVEN_g11106 [Fusarium venenatum]|nr:hypothetical protein FVEN_g11106 [Fusarium venenatum]